MIMAKTHDGLPKLCKCYRAVRNDCLTKMTGALGAVGGNDTKGWRAINYADRESDEPGLYRLDCRWFSACFVHECASPAGQVDAKIPWKK